MRKNNGRSLKPEESTRSAEESPKQEILNFEASNLNLLMEERTVSLSRAKYSVQHNNFVEAHYSLGRYAFYILRSMLERIDKGDRDFREFEIPVTEITSTPGGKNYDLIKLTCQKLPNKTVEIEEIVENAKGQAKRRFKSINLISYCEYVEDEHYIRARFNYDVMPYLLNLTKNFTKVEVQQLRRFTKYYDYRLYMLFKQYSGLGKRTISIEKLRAMLCLDDSYPSFYDFKRYVIEPAIKMINGDETSEEEEFAGSDLLVSYKVIKKGKKAVSIEFTIKEKQHKSKHSVSETQATSNQPDLFSGHDSKPSFLDDPRLKVDGKDFGKRVYELNCFDAEQTKKVVYNSSPEKLNKALHALKMEMKDRNLQTPPKWLVEKAFHQAGVRFP